jgi:hypothetical protein
MPKSGILYSRKPPWLQYKAYQNPVLFIATNCCGNKVYQNPVSFIATDCCVAIRYAKQAAYFIV